METAVWSYFASFLLSTGSYPSTFPDWVQASLPVIIFLERFPHLLLVYSLSPH